MRTSEDRLKVLSVVGAGRSGTTILASILNEVDGFASTGELRWLYERGIQKQRPCACGQAPVECPVWGPVVTQLQAGLGKGPRPLMVGDVVAALAELKGHRQFPRVLRSMRDPRTGWDALNVVRSATHHAVTAFAGTTGSRVVVDTSKRPLDAAIVAGIPEIDHYILHLVRDPRAVVHSWRRKKSFVAGGRAMTMNNRGTLATVRRWVTSATYAEALKKRTPSSRWLFMRYEDLADQPRPAIARIMHLLGESGEPSFADDHTVLLHPNHIVAGNPSRFTTGAVTILRDDAWRTEMPRHDQLLLALLTLAHRHRYGYLP